jgi:hypothetical protein
MHKGISDREKLHARAAILAAEDELSDTEIAQLCGITRRTLIRWKKQPAIRQKIDEHVRLIQLDSEVAMISERQKRVLHLDRRFQELQGIIRARGSSPEMRGAAGGSTGLMRRSIVAFSQRHGRLAEYNYRLDTALMGKQMRLLNEAAKAVGQCQTPKYQPTVVPTSTKVPSGKKHRAALFIADGTRSDLEIAAACGVNRRTLARWKEQPSFRARVADVRTAVFC